MNEALIRQIIREELQGMIELNRFSFKKNVEFMDKRNIKVGKTNGTKIGTASTEKLGFYGATPVIRPGHIANPSGGSTTDAEARTAINSILEKLERLGLLASS